MHSASDQWFVALGPDVILGPMPLNDVRQLASTGALLETDRVRQGGTNDWSLAKDVAGVFITATEEWVSIPADIAWETPTEGDSSIGLAPTQFSQAQPTTMKSTSSAIEVRSQQHSASSHVDRDETARPKSEPPRPKVSPRVIPPAPLPPMPADFEYVFPQASVANRTTQTRDKPAQSDERDRDVESQSDEVIRVVDDEPSNDVGGDSIATNNQPSVDRDPIHTNRPSIATNIQRPIGSQASSYSATQCQSRLNRNRPWLKPLLAVLVLIAIGGLGWTFWPSSEPHVYEDYARLYDLLKQHRRGQASGANWDNFVRQTKEATETSVPWLERTTRPGDRQKDLLLYVGRDLLAATEVAPTSEFRHEKRLDGFMKQLQEIYGH